MMKSSSVVHNSSPRASCETIDDVLEAEILNLPALPETFRTLRALGEKMGVTHTSVRRWVKKGMPVEPDGSFNPAKIQTWRKWYREQEKRGNRDSNIKALAEAGVKREKIAEAFGISESRLYGILKQVDANPGLVEKYRDKRASIMTLNQAKRQVIQDMVLDSITPEEIAEASIKEKAVLLDRTGMDKNREYMAERLESDKSTENTALIVKTIREAKERQGRG